MSQPTVVVPSLALRNLLRLARELALQLDADRNADDDALLEVRLLRAVEAVERHPPTRAPAKDEPPRRRQVGASRALTPRAER
jgi:hypothetical protein